MANQHTKKAEDAAKNLKEFQEAEYKAKQESILAEKNQRMAMTVKVVRADGTSDTNQIILPKIHQGEYFMFTIYPAVEVNG